MKLETILNAIEKTAPHVNCSFSCPQNRQYHAFRTRILRMDADKNAWIKELLEISTQERLLNSEGLKNDSNNS